MGNEKNELSMLSNDEWLAARLEGAHWERLRIADWIEEQPVSKATRTVLRRLAQEIRGGRVPPRAAHVTLARTRT